MRTSLKEGVTPMTGAPWRFKPQSCAEPQVIDQLQCRFSYLPVCSSTLSRRCFCSSKVRSLFCPAGLVSRTAVLPVTSVSQVQEGLFTFHFVQLFTCQDGVATPKSCTCHSGNWKPSIHCGQLFEIFYYRY